MAGVPPPADPLDDYRRLNDPVTRRRVERRGGYFVVEGLLALEALLGSPYPVRSVLASERRAARVAALVDGRAPLVVRPEADVAAVAGFDVHRGVLAAADRLPLPEPGALTATARLVVVAEGLVDHENVGALFRNAAAFGAGAVLLDPTTADPLYRRSVRVSVGHVLRVPWTREPRWPQGLADLARRGFDVVALAPTGEQALDDLAREAASGLRGPVTAGGGAGRTARLALVVGSEGAGLSAGALAASTRRVRIPLAPGVDSLNVATAAAVALHALAPASGVELT